MARGVLRLCTLHGEQLLRVAKPYQTLRLFTNSLRVLEKEASKPAQAIKGVSYKNLTIGVPKEKWLNEKR